MRNLVVIIILSVVVLSGCSRSVSEVDDKSAAETRDCVVWQSQGVAKPWRLVCQPDGSISEALQATGLHMILAEGGKKMEMGPSAFAHYMYGPCTWSYDQETNRLKAVVTIDDFYVQAHQSEISIMIIDELEGPLSEDGTRWNASWNRIERYRNPFKERVSKHGTLTLIKEACPQDPVQ